VALARLAWSYGIAGHLDAALDLNLSNVDLIPEADPMVRCSFLHVAATCQVLAGRYEEAAHWIGMLRVEARQARLGFVATQCDLAKARLDFSCARYADALSVVDRLLIRSRDDPYFVHVASALRLRITAVRGGRLPRATPDLALKRALSPNHGEYLASLAMLDAARGEFSDARRLAREACRVSRSVETRAYATASEAIAATRERTGTQAVQKFLRILLETDAYDALVCAYRIEPDVLQTLHKLGLSADRIASLTRDSGDFELARQLGLNPREAAVRVSDEQLTPREQQVLRLVEEGLTNREIADRLFISPSTAKVHVRHILEKFGVRTRTEAAIRGRFERE